MANRDIKKRSGRIRANELQIPVVVPIKATANIDDGLMYFNTSDDKLYIFYNGTWYKTAALT